VGDKTVSNIHEMQIAVGDEVAGVLGYGGASDMKTKLGLDLVDPNTSPEVFKSNMTILKHMLENRKNSMLKPMGVYGERKQTQTDNSATGAGSGATGKTTDYGSKYGF
jgi:hypothetical protein